MDKEMTISQLKADAFGQRLADVRAALGLKQHELSEDLELSTSYISQVEKGNSTAGFEFLTKLAEKHQVSLDYLFHGKGEMFIAKVADARNKRIGFDFGKHTENIFQILELMEKSPSLMHFMLSKYYKFTIENRAIIAKEIEEYSSGE